MTFEFDPAKDARNIRERGISLAIGVAVLGGLVGEFEDIRHAYGEKRMVAFGTVAGRLFCVVYTRRNNAVRLISVRKANKKEVSRWLPE